MTENFPFLKPFPCCALCLEKALPPLQHQPLKPGEMMTSISLFMKSGFMKSGATFPSGTVRPILFRKGLAWGRCVMIVSWMNGLSSQMARLHYIETSVGITTVWTALPLGCQSAFSQEYRIICKNARFVFLFRTNTVNLSALLLLYKLGEDKSKLSHTITFQEELKHCSMKTGSPS